MPGCTVSPPNQPEGCRGLRFLCHAGGAAGCQRRASTLARTLQIQGRLRRQRLPFAMSKRLIVVLPVVLPLNFRGKTVQTASAFHYERPCWRPCILRSKSGCRIGTAKQSPHRDKENTMTTAYRFMYRHTRNTLVARGWPASMDIDTSLN